MKDIMLSIHPCYIDAFKSRKKTLELRTRNINLNTGDKVWMYSTKPRGMVEVLGIVDKVISMSPDEMWNNHSNEMWINKKDFKQYFYDRKIAYAIAFKEIVSMEDSITLDTLRKSKDTFHPPQFFCYLSEKKGILGILQKGLSK